jgi:hypothetical protein
MDQFNEYKKIKKTIDLSKANIFGLFASIPIAIIYLVPFYLMWKEKFTPQNIRFKLQSIDFSNNALSMLSTIFMVIIVGIIVHELIHGITFAFFAKKGFKSITFGVLWKMLTPYCHCKEPMTVFHYTIGAIMPAIILGLIPAIVALVIGNTMIILFAYFFTTAAIGDFMIINLIRKESKGSLILDHPSEIGYFVLNKENSK